jgi:hypothetical protein
MCIVHAFKRYQLLLLLVLLLLLLLLLLHIVEQRLALCCALYSVYTTCRSEHCYHYTPAAVPAKCSHA